jgi:Tfp pilus assembly protein FimT
VTLNAYRFKPDGTKDTATVDTIAFDYKGLPTDRENLPFVITVTTAQAGTKQCVIVASLLGSLKTASDAQCDNPQVNSN